MKKSWNERKMYRTAFVYQMYIKMLVNKSFLLYTMSRKIKRSE